ncbi:hypothetical protein MMC08_004840 [Hypocenomyce scalaris]|nr:hypothetical protein [Hypocenomyce scalaris]
MFPSKSSNTPVSDTVEMIASMKPRLHSDIFVYTTVPYKDASQVLPHILPLLHTLTHEEEGLSLLLPEAVAKKHSLPTNLSPPLRHIELTVYSSLEGTGLTAAVASALSAVDIACNVVAGLRHDHLFVPEDKADEAVGVLEELARQTREIAEERRFQGPRTG